MEREFGPGQREAGMSEPMMMMFILPHSGDQDLLQVLPRGERSPEGDDSLHHCEEPGGSGGFQPGSDPSQPAG